MAYGTVGEGVSVAADHRSAAYFFVADFHAYPQVMALSSAAAIHLKRKIRNPIPPGFAIPTPVAKTSRSAAHEMRIFNPCTIQKAPFSITNSDYPVTPRCPSASRRHTAAKDILLTLVLAQSADLRHQHRAIKPLRAPAYGHHTMAQ